MTTEKGKIYQNLPPASVVVRSRHAAKEGVLQTRTNRSVHNAKIDNYFISDLLTDLGQLSIKFSSFLVITEKKKKRNLVYQQS